MTEFGQQPNDVRLLVELDRLCDEFEAAWRNRQSPQLAAFLSQVTNPELRLPLFRELLALELEYRRARGEQVSREDYRRQYSDLVAALESENEQDVVTVSEDGEPDVTTDSASTIWSPNQSIELLSDLQLHEASETPLDLRDYEIESQLGSGGQGDVFLAKQKSLGRQVAIKLLRRRAGDGTQSEQRFLREARTLAQTSHPQIVTIHGLGRSPDSELFLVMEYISGQDLARQLAEGPFSDTRAVEIVLQIANAVAHAHSRGVIHRDLKPSNILWHDVRGPVVTDFGLAKDLRAADGLTVTEQLLGTPTYMAPEQAHRRFGEISERTDVYGLAATLFAMLTGHPPIPPGPLLSVLQQLASDEPIGDPRKLRPDISPGLSAICLRGLAKFADQRFATVDLFAEALRVWLMGKDALAHPPSTLDLSALLEPRPVVLESGHQFGRYFLEETLSADPSRKVFRATDDAGVQVLLKCLPPEWLSDVVRRSHFRQEVMMACQVAHPCLAQVIEAGIIHNTEFLALEFVEGRSISERLDEEGRLTEPDAITILRPVAQVLHLMHQADIVYGDLRPANILQDQHGQSRLAEVHWKSSALAMLTLMPVHDEGDLAALNYQAPEFWLSQEKTAACDIYSLGATLFAMLTGEPPFNGFSDRIRLMMAKNAAQFTSPKMLNPSLSDDVCQLIESCLQPNRARRPASAEEFAIRLVACGQNSQGESVVAARTNLLHEVWEQLDGELQELITLAYNKKRLAGGARISTRDLFEVMVLTARGPLQEVLELLPTGSLPEPTDAPIPHSYSVLSEAPLLSNCIRDSLTEFRRLGTASGIVTPLDLFVDVAKYGQGESVIRLRKNGVDARAIDDMVDRLGLRILRRQEQAGRSTTASESSVTILSDDNVQFSVFRPKTIPPESWQPLLAFAHLSDLPADAPADMPDPIAEVQRQAAKVLGDKLPAFSSATADSGSSIPQSSLLTFVPSGEGLTFNPPERSFLWQEPVHREEFRFKAASHLGGKSVRGCLSVYLGRLLIAEVSIVTRIDGNLSVVKPQALDGENRARRFRRIFVSVSADERELVAEFQSHAKVLNDTYLMSQLGVENRVSGEDRFSHVQELIRSSDVFQLYWTNKALQSAEVERQWRYALSLRRKDFIRPIYWEEPFPTDPTRSLPPADLLELGFRKISVRPSGAASTERPQAISAPQSGALNRERSPRPTATFKREWNSQSRSRTLQNPKSRQAAPRLWLSIGVLISMILCVWLVYHWLLGAR